MKKYTLLTIILLFLIPPCVSAQNLIAVQSSEGVSMHSTLTAAIEAANNGDNIYLPGGIVQVGDDLIIDKRVNLYGIGYKSQTTSPCFPTIIANTSILEFNIDASGSILSGIRFTTNNLIFQGSNNILIDQCFFETWITFDGDIESLMIRESIFLDYFNGYSPNQSNWFFENSIFYEFGPQPFTNYQYHSYKNCILSMEDITDVLEYTTYENSIILMTDCEPANGCYNDSFLNCLFICPESLLTECENSQLANCIYNQSLSEIFVQYAGGNYNETDDYHLSPSNPGINAGSDGTDIGIYGTSSPFKESALPSRPHILFKDISPSTDLEGKLLINIQVEAQQN